MTLFPGWQRHTAKIKALHSGDFKQLLLTNKQAIWERCCDGQRVLIAINIEDQEYVAHFNANAGRALDLISGQMHDFGGGSHLPPYSVAFWGHERVWIA